VRAVRYGVGLIGGLDLRSILATDKIVRKSELFEGEKALKYIEQQFTSL
jgi:hypothetical protein